MACSGETSEGVMSSLSPALSSGGAHLPERLNDDPSRKFTKNFSRAAGKKNSSETSIRSDVRSRGARAERAPLSRDLVEPELRLLVVWEALLVGAERLGVVVAAAVDEPRGVLDV